MSIKWKLNYGLAAVIAAVIVIAVALLASPYITNPITNPGGQGAAVPFLVLLTDPPTVPAGTTELNMTYSDVALHIGYPNGTDSWLSLGASGTVNLLSLVNMSQTLAAITIPENSTVDQIQFTIVDVKATINGEVQNVTALSNTIALAIENDGVNQTLSGVLVDFNPTVMQIEGTDINGNVVNYYVMVPSASARIIDGLSDEQRQVGCITGLQKHHRDQLDDDENETRSNNATITAASLTVNGNSTELSVTIRNDGNSTFRLFGLTLKGDFNSSQTRNIQLQHGHQNGHNNNDDETNDEENNDNNGHLSMTYERINHRAVPFKVNGTSLIPLMGDNYNQDHDDRAISAILLQPGETITLTFSGSISIQHEDGDRMNMVRSITPVVGSSFTIRLMGEGFQTFNVTATA